MTPVCAFCIINIEFFCNFNPRGSLRGHPIFLDFFAGELVWPFNESRGGDKTPVTSDRLSESETAKVTGKRRLTSCQPRVCTVHNEEGHPFKTPPNVAWLWVEILISMTFEPIRNLVQESRIGIVGTKITLKFEFDFLNDVH